VRELVALDLPGGPAFVAALQRAWDRGDAVLPVDQRLPAPARRQLLDAARPHTVVDGAGDRAPFEPHAPLLDDGDALVVASSGSTGTPKLVVHTRAGIVAHARAVHEHLAVDPAVDRWLACLPLAHLGGLGVVLRALVTDTPVDVVPSFDAAEVAGAPSARGTTLVSLVPTALDRLDPTPFRWVVLGGSADVVVRPANVVHTYGLTETGGGVVYDGVALPGVTVRVDQGGAIAVGGPTLARGIRAPDGHVSPVTGPDGWLATGDLGAWSGDGRLAVHGRADDLIVTGGENVWPATVEAAVASHPAVAEVAVVGRPDPEWGTSVVAVVVPATGAAAPSLDDLRSHVRSRLPAYAAPRRLVVVDALPRTALGKVRRAELAGPTAAQ
jgi:O-succinylbenzoic acid--CoA ligase